MKIEHVTYDTTHPRRLSMRRASDATFKIKNYISKRFSRHADMHSPLQNPAERLINFWPQLGTESSVPDSPEMTAYLTKQHRGEKAAPKEEKFTTNPNHSGNFLPLKDEAAATDDAVYPPLRRRGKFVKDKGKIKSKNSRPQTADGNPNMEKLHKLRQAMKEGIMEQAVPPNHESEDRRAFPRNRLADTLSRVSAESSRGLSSSRYSSPHSTQSIKTKSSSRVKDYIRTGVDTLDEKRKEVQSKFQAPFEHLKYPSFSKARRDSTASDESFFCVGEIQEQISDNNSSARRHDSAAGRRYSGIGTNPWSSHVPDTCKSCRKFAMVGIQGLCERCEADFWLRKAKNQNSDSDYEDDLRSTPPLKDDSEGNIKPTPPLKDDSEEDIKPTAPLKDSKPLSMRKKLDLQHSFQVEMDSLENVRSTIALKDTGSRPVFNPFPVRQFSQKAQVEADEDELTKTQRMVERWSTNFEDNGVAYAEERDAALSHRRKSNGLKAGTRDTNFYRFYDDVLDD